MVRLEVHDGSRRRTVSVMVDPVRIGRDETCEVQLPGDPTVSRLHAILRTQDGHWVVQDGGSRNGTYLNGRKVSGPAAIRSCDRLLIGDYVVVFQGDEDAPVQTIDAQGRDLTRTRLETGLSARELDVLRLVCAGHGDLQVAGELFISVKTVHSHLDRIRDKTGCRRRVELVRYAIDHGIA
ncbi:regulatory protein, luxR family [Nakamurella panacisegetis]|uniref:Regulatory protein, luxR family n=1 Tax=Nakamurella panacisegetis TaxID=1090615 RepID=A0A1H0N813_9ACTN|nr:FHA domain-containing protein [Nakamurella panacisegetis]SDO88625.1 regulatory protein, luxR family [Nakamurella panacisegetis]